MINLMVKNIFENSTKIESIIKHVRTADKKHFFGILMLSTSMWAIATLVKQHEEKINNLEEELERVKSILA